MVATFVEAIVKGRTCPDCPHKSRDFHNYRHLHLDEPTEQLQDVSIRGGGAVHSTEVDVCQDPQTLLEFSEPQNANSPQDSSAILDDESPAGGDSKGKDDSITKIVADESQLLRKIADAVNDDDSGSDKYLSAEENLQSSIHSLDSPEMFLRMLDGTRGPAFLAKGKKHRVYSKLDKFDFHAPVYVGSTSEHDLSAHLERRVNNRKENPDSPLDLGPEEFYELMWFSKIDSFLSIPKYISTDYKVAQRALYDVEICKVCKCYTVVLKKTGGQVRSSRGMMLCGGCESD